MGLTASNYLISQQIFDSVMIGDYERFNSYEFKDSISLDKYWHAIHHIITGDNQLGFLTSGYQIGIMEEHAEVHSPEAMKSVYLFFADKKIDEIVSDINWKEMNNEKNLPGGMG